MRVLVVDDEEAVRIALSRALTAHGFDVSLAADSFEGRNEIAGNHPDVILLDVTMPKVDGLRMCRQLREAGDRTPIILLTARTRVAERVAGLDAGADDYLTKPFALDELLARIRVVTRRAAGAVGEGPLTYSDLTLDPQAHEATRAGVRIALSQTESRLLELLMRHAERPVTREEILREVWGYDFGGTSNPHEVYVGYLRRKLEPPGADRLIHTVRGVGYMVRET